MRSCGTAVMQSCSGAVVRWCGGAVVRVEKTTCGGKAVPRGLRVMRMVEQ
jgi:hypothetical protein